MNLNNIFTKPPIIFREKIQEMPQDNAIFFSWITHSPNFTTDSRSFKLREINRQTGESTEFLECRTYVIIRNNCDTEIKRLNHGIWEEVARMVWFDDYDNGRVAITSHEEVEMRFLRVRKNENDRARRFKHNDIKFKWLQFRNEGMVCLTRNRRIVAYFEDNTQMLVVDRAFWNSLNHIICTCLLHKRRREHNVW